MVLVKSIKKFTEGLTARQKKTMNAHARHHSLKHMRSMANSMKKGSTFAEADRKAKKLMTVAHNLRKYCNKNKLKPPNITEAWD